MTPQPLSRTVRLMFAAVLLGPVVFVLVSDHGGREVTVRADLRVLDDDRTVRSSFTTNSCGRALRLDVDESAREVRVRSVVLQERGIVTGCEDAGIPRTLDVVLDEPLGDRRLVAVEPRSSADGR